MLLLVCDEFSELLSEKPDFIDLFVAIGRLGRSLGVHLLLASQRLDEGRLRRSRLALVLSDRSADVLGDGVAVGAGRLGRVCPGCHGRPATDIASGHRAARAGSGRRTRRRPIVGVSPVVSEAISIAPSGWRMLPFTAAPCGERAAPVVAAGPEPPQTQTMLAALTDAISASGHPAHRVWLPPLTTSDPLDLVLGPLVIDPSRGLTTADTLLRGSLRAAHRDDRQAV